MAMSAHVCTTYTVVPLDLQELEIEAWTYSLVRITYREHVGDKEER